MRFLCTVAALLLMAGASAPAADNGLKEYKALMKAAAKADGRLESALKDEDAAGVQSAAEVLSQNMAGIANFWSGQDDAQAAEWAVNIQRAADEIAADAEASDFAAAQTSFDGFRENCRSCHEAHRKMSLGGWKFK